MYFTKRFSVILSILITLISLFLLVFFSLIPSTSMWKGYVVLYADCSIPEEKVLTALENKEIKNVLTLSRQRQPVVSTQAPVQPQDLQGYLSQRKSFFFDKETLCQLYYVPNVYSVALKSVASDLATTYKNLSVGLDLQQKYPWIVPLICFVSFIIFIVASKTKFCVFVSGIFPLIYSFCLPMYNGGAAAILLMYSAFAASTIWRRRGMLKVLSRTVWILVLFLLPIPVAFASSIHNGFMILPVYAGMLALLYLLDCAISAKNATRSFSALPILSAQMISLVNKKNKRFIFVPVVTAALFIVAFIFSDIFVISKSEKDLYIPAPTEYTVDDGFTVQNYEYVKNAEKRAGVNFLPGMVQYVSWVWNTLTFPYKPLIQESLEVSLGDVISVPNFRINENGFIQEYSEIIYVFDDEFISSVIDTITYDSEQIELLFKEQETFVGASYMQIASGNVTEKKQGIVIFALLLSMFTPLIIGSLIWRNKK